MSSSATLTSCMPVIPSANLENSLRFWVTGLGFSVEDEMRQEGRLVGCMLRQAHILCWLNQRAGTTQTPDDYEGIRLYWAPADLQGTWMRLRELGYSVSAIEQRDYGQTEFFATDDDGHTHCFGVAIDQARK